jgi:hypothetical protein
MNLLMVAQVFLYHARIGLQGQYQILMTTTIEKLQKELQDVRAIRQGEAFDMKNAGIAANGGMGATRFTQQRWEELTVQVQATVVVSDLLAIHTFPLFSATFRFSVSSIARWPT